MNFQLLAIIFAGCLAVYIAVKLLASPLKWLMKLLLNGLLGIVLLILVNVVGGFFNYYLPITALRVVISAVAGIPGVILIVLLDLLF